MQICSYISEKKMSSFSFLEVLGELTTIGVCRVYSRSLEMALEKSQIRTDFETRWGSAMFGERHQCDSWVGRAGPVWLVASVDAYVEEYQYSWCSTQRLCAAQVGKNRPCIHTCTARQVGSAAVPEWKISPDFASLFRDSWNLLNKIKDRKYIFF